MKWEDYKQIYWDYELLVTQTRLFSDVSGSVLRDFPKSLPKDISTPVLRRVKRVFETIVEYVDQAREGDRRHIDKEKVGLEQLKGEIDKIGEPDPYLVDDIFTLLTLAIQRGSSWEDVDFSRLRYAQELVMHHSNFEGILADSVRTICKICPSVMKKTKTVEWEEILSSGSWDGLMTLLAERFVRDISWETLEKRLALFKELFGLEIQYENDDKEIIREIDLARNLIVHNGGKANDEYLILAHALLKKQKSLKVGDYIPLDADYLKIASTTLNMVASEVYVEVSKKYFHRKEDEILLGIWHRRGL